EALVAGLDQATEGNPFFVDEVVRLLLAEKRLHEPAGPAPNLGIPQGVREAIRRRLRPLSEEAGEVLTLASAVGREFDLACLREVTGLTGDRLLELLGEATELGVVTRLAQPAGRYGFSHVLIREVLYDALTPTHRSRAHRRIGEALERLYGADLAPHSAELAHHFFEASGGGDLDKAVSYAVRAGEHAAALLAYEEAAEHVRRALEALGARPEDEVTRCELLLAIGEARLKAGDGAAAREQFHGAVAL